MEAVIQNSELLNLVFQQLRFTDEPSVKLEEEAAKTEFLQRWKPKKKALLKAALTCKAFFQPAMENLWSTVDGIKPLFKLLPNVDHGGRNWSLNGDVDEERLERLDFYARMVVHIIDLNRMGYDDIGSLLIRLADIRPGGRCFPRLRTVRMFSYDPDLLVFYMSPVLQQLQMRGFRDVQQWFKPMCGIVARLPTRSPDLEDLDLPFVPNARAMDAIFHLQNLRSFCVQSFSTPGSLGILEFLKGCSKLPCLQKLELKFPPTFHGPAKLPPPTEQPSSWFPRLASISVGGNPNEIISLIDFINPTHLEELECQIDWGAAVSRNSESPHLGQEVASLATAIQTRLCTNLKSLSLIYDPKERAYVSSSSVMVLKPATISDKFITPLLSIPTLESVVIDPSLSLPGISDSFLSAIPRAWPKLRKLSLPSSKPSAQTPFTLGAVQQFLAGLPHLSELSLELVADGALVPGLQAPQLTVLNVRNSPITSKKQTALNLAAAFPNLETLQYPTQESPSSLLTQWKEVDTWLPIVTGKYNAVDHYDEV